jgi:hypothetical protein
VRLVSEFEGNKDSIENLLSTGSDESIDSKPSNIERG